MNSIHHSHPDSTENSGCSGAFAILNVTRGSRTWKQAVPIRSSAHKSALPVKQKASSNAKQDCKARLIEKRFISIDIKATAGQEPTTYRVYSDAEIRITLSAQGWTHWRRVGGGVRPVM